MRGSFFSLCYIFSLCGLMCCDQNQTPTPRERNAASTIVHHYPKSKIPIDYKSATYQLKLGENFKNYDPPIDWHWAAEADKDGIIDSSAFDSFLCLQEPLFKYDGGEYLFALHIETNKNLIVDFNSSILFNLTEDKNAKANFLKRISKDFKKLEIDSVSNKILADSTFINKQKDFIESYTLINKPGFEYDRFIYSIKYNR